MFPITVLRKLVNTSIGLATYLLLWPEDGIMRKEDIRGVYDGSIFYKKAEEYKTKIQMRKEQRERTYPNLISKVQKVL